MPKKKANNYNAVRLADGAVTPSQLTELTEHWQESHGLKVDGMYGPQTQASVQAAVPTEKAPRIEGGWSMWSGGPLDRIPRSRKEMYEVYGNPGQGKVNKDWEAKSIITVRDLPGVPSKWHFRCHRLVEPYLREGLLRAARTSDYKIERAASFVFRHIRHDPSRPLSTHAFGAGVDFDPKRNWYKVYKRKGLAPAPWSEDYMRIWPDGVDQEFVAALQSVGFSWGSDWDSDGDTTDHTFLDPMHFELVDRRK